MDHFALPLAPQISTTSMNPTNQERRRDSHSDIMTRMHYDRKMGDKEYRVVLDPISAGNPEGSKFRLFIRDQGRLTPVGNETIAMPGQSDEDLLTYAWQKAEQHSRNS
jgi:hypothetical protein